MTNTLWVKFKDDSSIYNYSVALGNNLWLVIQEIQTETGRTIEKASYNRVEVE